MRRLPAVAGLVLVLLGGCAGHGGRHVALAPHPVVTLDPTPDVAWRGIAHAEDRAVIDDLGARWQAALDRIARRYATRLKTEGALLEPGSALPLPQLPPGPYWCRLVRIGGQPGYVAYRPDRCEVAGDATGQSLTKQTGQSLPGGWLYSDDAATRLVFLGARRPDKDSAAPGYGTDGAQDIVGVVERVGPFRWRFVMPNSDTPGTIDVMELTPIAPPPGLG